MALRKTHKLERVLGANALAATAYGNLGSSLYYALGLVAALALGFTPAVFVLSGLLFLVTAMTYAEATAMLPEAGGASSFARHAFNEFVAFIAGWGGLLTYTVTIGISAYFVPHYIGGLWEPLSWMRHAPGDIGVAIFLIVVLGAVNIRGAQEAAILNVGLALADFLTQLLLVALGFFVVFNLDTIWQNISYYPLAPTTRDLLVAVPLSTLAYTGIETISNMAAEAKDAARTVPRSIKRVVFAVFAIYLTLPLVALSALPVEKHGGEYVTKLGLPEAEGGYAGDPILGIVKGMDLGPLQFPAELYVGVLAATILLIAANAGIIGVSRLVYSMGSHRHLPERLQKLHPKYKTPALAIAVFSGLACLTVVSGEAEFIGSLYAFGAMLGFTIAHLSLIRLRSRHPDKSRSYRVPWTITAFGHPVPVPAALGAAGCLTAFVVLGALNPTVTVVGFVWLFAGAVGYVAYRNRLGLSLTTTATVHIPDAVTDHEVEYGHILVASTVDRPSPEAVAAAARLAARKRRDIYLVVLIEVPLGASLDAPMELEEKLAKRQLDHARRITGRKVSGRSVRIRPGQQPSRVMHEARLIGAHAIVMAMPHASWRQRQVFDNTLTKLLTERPCRIVLYEAQSGQRNPNGRASKYTHFGDPPPPQAPRRTSAQAQRHLVQYRSILVPQLGSSLDDDIMQTAGRLALAPAKGEPPSLIEALGVVEVPTARQLDDIPIEERADAAALIERARRVGEEYEGVRVREHLVSARSAGQAIVGEAARLGVEVIVMAAEAPSVTAGGRQLGGRDTPLDFTGQVSRYVMAHAACEVLLTAPSRAPTGRLSLYS